MKKQYGFCRTALLLCTWLFSTAVWAYDFDVDGIYYNILSSDDKTVAVTKSYSSDYSGDVTIPATVTNEGIEYRVTAIGDEAFFRCDNLTSVTIGEGVTTIGNKAFCDCESLTSVMIENGVQTIGGWAFSGCSDLTEFKGKFASDNGRCLIVNDTLKAFAPSGLTEYTIPEDVITIGEGTFSYCSDLTSVMIPESVQSIGDYAFYHCYGLTSVTIPNSVTTIGGSAFSWCDALASVTISAGVTTIGDRAFASCKSLKEITIPNSVTTIDEYAFGFCTCLSSVTAYNPTPVNIGIFVFYLVDCANCTLYVPAGSADLYSNAEGWAEFGTILPIDESSAITEIRQDKADGHVTVYNLQGVLVLETDDAADLKTLQNGAYIVNGKKMIIVR